jgi:5'-deoxynucleotidase YfbR-like HD superfamily hydrolase
MTENEFRKPRFVAIIPRWSVVPVTRRQSNGEHIFLVARYAVLIAGLLGSKVNRFSLLDYALRHDDEEAVTGDLPSGSPLAAHKGEPERDEIYLIVKAADRLEAYQYGIEEVMLGNQFMSAQIPDLYQKFIDALLVCPGSIDAVLDAVGES